MLGRAVGIPVVMVVVCRLMAEIAISLADQGTDPGWLPLIAAAGGGGAGLLGGSFAGLVSARASERDALLGWLTISGLAGLPILSIDAVPHDGSLLLLLVAVVLTSNLALAIPGVLLTTRIRRTRCGSRARTHGDRS